MVSTYKKGVENDASNFKQQGFDSIGGYISHSIVRNDIQLD